MFCHENVDGQTAGVWLFARQRVLPNRYERINGCVQEQKHAMKLVDEKRLIVPVENKMIK